MRRGLASLIMGLSLLVATASWAGFVMSRTVLDPGRSDALADVLLDDPQVRATIVDRLADSAETQIPADIPVTRDVIETAADDALNDPAVEGLIKDGLVQAHQNALAGIDEPVMLDAAALGTAGRAALVAQQPELEPFLPPTPALEVELPSTGLAWLGTVKRFVDRFTLFGAIVAAAGVTAAFVLARSRPAALRRVAFWAIGASAFWIAAAYALPWVLERIAPSSVSIASGAIDVFFGAMIGPASVLAGAGVALLVLSFIWPAFGRRRPAAMLDRAPTGSGAVGGAGAVGRAGAQSSIDLRRPVPPHPPTSRPDPGWAPAASAVGAQHVPSRPVPYDERSGYEQAWAPAVHHAAPQQAPIDPTRPFPQIWSNVEGAQSKPNQSAGAQPGHPSPSTTPTQGASSAAMPRPTVEQASAAPETAIAVPGGRPVDQAPPTEVASPAGPLPPAGPAPATEAVAPDRYGYQAQATEAVAPPVAPPPPGAAPATQIAQPGDFAAAAHASPARKPEPAAVPVFEVDPDAAAEADDFGAEWVEGVGYVEDDSAR